MLAFLVGMALPAAAPQQFNDDPGLAMQLIETVAQVCVPVARGKASLGAERDAARFKLQPVAVPPAFLSLAFPGASGWHVRQGSGESLFVSETAARHRCQIVLANTRRTQRVQGALALNLRATGYAPIVGKEARPDPGYVDQLWVRPSGRDYLIIWVQAPHDTVRGGAGDQGTVTVATMPRAQFDALAKSR